MSLKWMPRLMVLIFGFAILGNGNTTANAELGNQTTGAAGSYSSSANQRQQPADPEDCESLETCYNKAQMQQFFDQIIIYIEDFNAATFEPAIPRPNYYFVATGQSGPTGCRDSQGTVAYDSTAYFYCPPDRAIYIGQDELWSFYGGHGDAAAAIAIAHEWGHHSQNMTGVQLADLAQENQADCISGAWYGYMMQRGITEPDDIDDVAAILIAIGQVESADDPTRKHGTTEERVSAFGQGMNNGLRGCAP
ncbi:MAG: neutral zinc metallopeptidase [Pseudonocardiaceae bacterium]